MALGMKGVGYPTDFHGFPNTYRQPMPSSLIQALRQHFPVRAMPAVAATPIRPGPRPPLVGTAQVLDLGPSAPMIANATRGATSETLAGLLGA